MKIALVALASLLGVFAGVDLAQAQDKTVELGTYKCDYRGTYENVDIVITSRSSYTDIAGATGEFGLFPEGFNFFSGPFVGYQGDVAEGNILLRLPGTGRELTCVRQPA